MMPTFKQFKGSYREACHVLKARSSIVNGETVYGDASLLCQSATIAENESAIEKDLARTPYFSQQISLSQMKRQWLSEGKHYAFSQGNFSGENFTTLPVVAKAYETEDLHQKTGLSKVFSVAYLDETGRPSAFSVAVDLLDPTQFIVAHVYGTTESLDAREAVLIGRPDYFLKGKGEKTIRVGIQDAILTGIRDEALKERVADLFYFPVIGKSYVDPEKLAELSKWVGVNHNTDDWPKNVIKEQCDSLGNVIAKKTQGVSELSSPLLAKFDATNVSLLKAMEEILADLPSYTERESYFEKDKEALRSAIQRIEHFSDSNLQSIGWHELASKLEIILLRMTIPNDVVFKFYEHIKSIHEKILQLYYLKEPLEESKLLDLYHLFSRAVDRIILKESLLAPYNEILALQKKVISINSPKLKTSIKEQYYRIATCLMQYNDAQIREINVLIKETTELSNKIAVEKIIDALDGCEKTLEETVGEGSSLSGVIKKLTGELENKMTSGVSTDDIQEAESQVCLFKISIEAHDLIDSLNCLSRKLDLNLPSEVHINKEIIICKDKLFGSFGEKGLIVDKERFTELKQQTMLLKEKGVENLSLKGAQIRSGLKAIQDALIEAPYQALCRQSKTYDSWVKQLFQKTQPIYSKMWKWDNFTRGSVASFEAFYAELQLALDELNQTEALLNDRMLHAIKEESFSPLIKKLELMQASLSSYTVTKKEEATEIVRLNQEIEEKINALKKARSSSCSIESILTLYATSHRLNSYTTLHKSENDWHPPQVLHAMLLSLFSDSNHLALLS